uniref:Uncharacterized protein n=1 Tax=Anguilla anguilla TaxID=7936 RepID=A0A0E9RKP1_ANGAN
MTVIITTLIHVHMQPSHNWLFWQLPLVANVIAMLFCTVIE